MQDWPDWQGMMCTRVPVLPGIASLPATFSDVAYASNKAALAGFRLVEVEYGMDTAEARRILGDWKQPDDRSILIPVYVTLLFKREAQRPDEIAQPETEAIASFADPQQARTGL